MKKLVRKIDSVIMIGFEWATSTRGALYLLMGMILFSASLQPPTNISAFMVILVSEFYQGCALPALGIGTKIEGEKTRFLLQETHDMVMQEIAEMKEIHETIQQELSEIKEILDLLKKG